MGGTEKSEVGGDGAFASGSVIIKQEIRDNIPNVAASQENYEENEIVKRTEVFIRHMGCRSEVFGIRRRRCYACFREHF